MSTVIATRFRDGNGTEHALRDMDPDERLRWHYTTNRKANGLDCYCLHCAAAVFPVQHTTTGLWFVRHERGADLGDCEYADIYQRIRSGTSTEHKEAAATICIATRKVAHWNAEVEKRLHDHQGTIVQPDVYAWHTTPTVEAHRPVIHEIQLSPHGFDETWTRTRQRAQADQFAKTLWWTPDLTTIVSPDYRRVDGIVINREATHVVARAFTEIEPELVPMRPTIAEAARRLAQDRNGWAIIDIDGEGPALVPLSVGSSTPRKKPQRPTPDVDVTEAGCERTPRRTKAPPATTKQPNRFCTGLWDGNPCGLTATTGSTLCWAHASAAERTSMTP